MRNRQERAGTCESYPMVNPSLRLRVPPISNVDKPIKPANTDTIRDAVWHLR